MLFVNLKLKIVDQVDDADFVDDVGIKLCKTIQILSTQSTKFTH